ncbi:unnamed protein product, partial [Schistosoma spindalis]
MSHNHPCSSSWMVCNAWSRRLSSEEKENFKPVILHAQSTDEVIESTKERTGKQITAADVKTMKAKLSTGCTRMHVLRQNGEVREHVENRYITRMCFSSYGCTIYILKSCVLIRIIIPIIKSGCSLCYIALCRYSLFQLVVTDNFGRGRPVIFCWTKKEMCADVTWILEKFKEVIGNTSKTQTFVIDCARAESAAVRITHSNDNIILCVFHTHNKILRTYLTRLVTAETVGRIINQRD